MNNENDTTIQMAVAGDTTEVDAWPQQPRQLDLTPGQLDEIGAYVQEHLEKMGIQIHQAAVLARFVPTGFECREGGAYVTVQRRYWGPVQQWLVQSYPVNRVPLMPEVIGVWEDREIALQAASDAVDAVLAKEGNHHE